ncbi:MAG: DUF480 domain-containing protein, partial [Vicinamibacterales bacterium]
LPRRAGQKEVRFAHLLSGAVAADDSDAHATTPTVTRQPSDERIAALEQIVAELRSEIDDMRQQLQDFRKQLE